MAAAFALALWVIPARVLAQDTQDQNNTKPAAAQTADTTPKPRLHRVITNDDLPSRTTARPSTEVDRLVDQLNFCDHACFQEVFKDSSNALHQHWPYPFTMQETQLIEDALLQRLQRLRADTEWQNRMRNMVAAHVANCQAGAKFNALRERQRASGKSLTPADLAAQEALEKEPASHLPGNNDASSALLSYRERYAVDPLRSALMLHQYFQMIKMPCPPATNPDP